MIMYLNYLDIKFYLWLFMQSLSLKVGCDLLAVMLLHSHALTISVTIIHTQELRIRVNN